ncbi:peptide-binding protein [Prosthecochloris sp.]|uniref:peptide-binding protein n=1 Tax=Prosthecochloris sp. TaxID=290513 RepID=UPI0025EC1AAE|nr:peptide-binding protein [Prosthecochloris sp.]
MLGDASYLNPVIGASVTSRNVYSLLYPGLLKSEFDTTSGLLNFMALEKKLREEGGQDPGEKAAGALARTWKMSEDHRSITYMLRSDAFWNDGVPITSHDFKFTYELYANPVIASPRQQYLAELIGAEEGEIDFDNAIETPDDTTLVFNFYKPIPEQLALFHTTLTPLPKHVWREVPSQEFRHSSLNQNPLGAGPYVLQDWQKQQQIVLASNPKNNLPKPGTIPRIMFRIVPDYTVRLAQLQTGAVDVVENIKPEDFDGLATAKAAVEIKPVGLRVYDYVGWSNIDHTAYHRDGTIKPHPLFGSTIVRRALTLAIDRQSILDGYLGEYGVVASTDISPSLKWAYNDAVVPYSYDPAESIRLLEQEGWVPGPDGIREKNGRKFSFVLFTNAGNERRNFASVIIQQNLREIGIDCQLDVQESNVFFENLRLRKIDAWMAGWSIGLEIDPLDGWGSDLEKSRFNFTGYQNPRIDELCELAKTELNPLDARPYWMEYQEILHRDQPTTFLYWIQETQGFNKRVEGEELNILSTFYNVDDWTLSPSASVAE